MAVPIEVGSRFFERGPLRGFAYPQFPVFWSASLLSIVTFMMSIIARGWLILQLTDSPFMVTAINAVQMLPMMAFSLIGGAIADRWNRRVILITTDAFIFAILLTMALLLYTDHLEVWHVFGLALLNGAASSMAMPARIGLVSNLVNPRDLSSSIALYSAIFSISSVAGPASAGFLINSYGMSETFLFASLLLLPAIGGVWLLRVQGKPSGSPEVLQASILTSILEGLAYVRGSALLRGIMAMSMVAMIFAMPFQSILPVFARDILHVGAAGLGWLGAVMGVGSVIGSFVVASFSSHRRLKLFLIIGGVGVGLMIAIFSSSTIFSLSLFLAFILGFMLQLFMTSNLTLIQVASPEHIRGRVFSIRMVVMGMSPVGTLLLGVGAEVTSPAVSSGAMGLIAVSMMLLVVWVFPAVREVGVDVQGEGS